MGGRLDTRILSREHSYNYKLRATWLTPEVIRATARLAQVRNWLSVEETLALVAEAEAAGDTVILVEIDPREGSGVVPRGLVVSASTEKGAGDFCSLVEIERDERPQAAQAEGARRRHAA